MNFLFAEKLNARVDEGAVVALLARGFGNLGAKSWANRRN